MAKPPAPDPRAARLAAALRANLAKRKARDRESVEPPPLPAVPPGD